jgi:cellulose synthase/poly-beta-1,6-N-acetylglucosamine synthase-like glycosyltransferase
MIYIYFIITLIFSFITALVSLYNLVTRPVLQYRSRNTTDTKPLVSVLIPARNEEKIIERMLYTIMQQTYRNLEIIVLDDHSEDRTHKLAESVANIERRLRVITGKELPAGWTGKNWACHQLSLHAKGEILLFVDADVQLAPEAVSTAVTYMHNDRLSMLSLFSTQIMKSFGERLVVPLMNWLLLAFLPLRLVAGSPNPKFVAANGQFIMIRKDIYDTIGGHETVKDRVVEDMEIARTLKRNGKRVMTLLGGELVSCRMYTDVGDAVRGFTKNFYAGFNTSKILFITMLFVFAAVFLGPFIAIVEYGFFIYPVIFIVLSRLCISIVSQQSVLYNILLHPVHMLIMVIIGIRSVEAYSKKQIVWKGRRL